MATTNADAEALRRRWPAKWVEWIPYGCPPALHGARAPRGAIAIVGEAPDAERAAREARLRVVLLAPGERAQPELARLLATQSDVVVFADAAACRLDVGAALASGVPVVARPDPRPERPRGRDLSIGRCRRREPSGCSQDIALRREVGAAAREYCHEHSWNRVARRHVALWTALEAT